MAERLLYGVNYGVNTEDGPRLFVPGRRLIKELEALPFGASIGIDSFPESVELHIHT